MTNMIWWLPMFCSPSALLTSLVALLPSFCFAATFTVSNVNDSGPGSLRQALMDAGINPGRDAIHFNIAGAPPFRIALAGPLPAMGEMVDILGDTQPGYAGTPLVEIDGQNAGAASGLELLAGQSTVKALGFIRFSRYGIVIEGNGENQILGNFIGCTGGGRVAAGNALGGVVVRESAINAIGGTGLNDGNVISGNGGHGVEIRGTSAFGNYVAGNKIGVDSTGTNSLGNSTNGVYLSQAPGNVIGGSSAPERNIISGNKGHGINVSGEGAVFNQILGNYVGLSSQGNKALSNSFDGIVIFGAGLNNIGSGLEGSGNVVSGNGNFGIVVTGALSISNVISGNLIGTDATGSFAVKNRRAGGIISEASFTLIGGLSASERNVFSGNGEDGLVLTGSGCKSNTVQGNFIGVNANGNAALTNLWSGIRLDRASYNQIGGVEPGAGNIISGNGDHGILISAGAQAFNKLQGNRIGTDISGTEAIPNELQGIRVIAGGNLIGGAEIGAGNIVSGNKDGGIYMFASSNNVIKGNLVGLSIDGTNIIANLRHGIGFENSRSNVVGGPTESERNIISGNVEHGIMLYGMGSVSNRITGNFIGTTVNGKTKLANDFGGIYSYSAGTNLIGGSLPGEGNVISGNRQCGISIGGTGAHKNIIFGNSIGTRFGNRAAIQNQIYAIEFVDEAHRNTVGGTGAGEGNTINYRDIHAAVAVGNTTLNNAIRGNSMWSSSGVPIDIGKDGHTLNDATDADGDGNAKQNFPLLSGAQGTYRTVITGSISSLPNRNYGIDFFYSSTSNNPAGQAERYLGSAIVTAGASGFGAFTAVFTNVAPISGYISATATDPNGNSSEVSFSVMLGSSDTDGDGIPDDFETLHGLQVSVDDRQLDRDGDGLSNEAEFKLGTSPSDANSKVGLIGIQKNGNRAVLAALTVPGRNYRVEFSDNPAGPWTQGPAIAASGSLSVVTNTPGPTVPIRFYRMYQE